MHRSTKSFRRTIYMIVLLATMGSLDMLQIYNSDLNTLCFVELIDGETEPEDKESNEKFEYDFSGSKTSRDGSFSYLSNSVDARIFSMWNYQLMDIITPPPEAL